MNEFRIDPALTSSSRHFERMEAIVALPEVDDGRHLVTAGRKFMYLKVPSLTYLFIKLLIFFTLFQVAVIMDDKIPLHVQKQVEQLRDWINRQPHLPKDIGKHSKLVHSC